MALDELKCKWLSCNARLNNLDALHKHIVKAHKPSDEEVQEHGFSCWWKKCPHLKFTDDGKAVPTHTFNDMIDWMDHIDQDHLSSIAMKYGNGLTNRTPVPDAAEKAAEMRTRFLSDSNHRLTTPGVPLDTKSDLPLDALVLIPADSAESDVKAQEAWLKEHGHKKSRGIKALAKETLRGMEARKRDMVGIDRGGCTLVNEARRSTLEQNPGIQRIVGPEDDD